MRLSIVITTAILLAIFSCAPQLPAQAAPAEKEAKSGGRAVQAQPRPFERLTADRPGKEYIYAGDRLLAIDEGDLAAPSAPGNLTAVACYGPQIYLTWTDNSSDETSFTLERRAGGGAYAAIPLAAGTTKYLDSGLSASTTYTYRVKASHGGGDSPYSDEVSTATAAAPGFTDDPIVAGLTPVRAVHVSELRQAVGRVRACARLGAASWSSPALAGDPVYAADVQELRDRLAPALVTLGTQGSAYTDEPVAAGTAIKAVHIDELRQAVQ